jgi:signal peptidase I
MAKKKTPDRKSPERQTPPSPYAPRSAAPADKAPAGKSSDRSSMFSARSIRETIESLAVAFILAFLFRTFEAEAFVIPTGSMAPTLLGQNKDLWCPKCGYHYQAGASSEDEQLAEQRGQTGSSPNVVAVMCPLCRYMANVDPRTAEGREHPSYGGDRILVSKLAYEFGEPERWDVAVFKYPGGAQTNYIKRLVGLPNETIRIQRGDLHTHSDQSDDFHIERRPPEKLRAMAQIVYDNDYLLDELTQKGWPLRWQPWPVGSPSNDGGWTSADGGRSFEVDGSAGETRWIRYRHFVPSLEDWALMRSTSLPKDRRPAPSLVTDFYAYDTSVSRGQPEDQPQFLGMHWVGDLLVECELQAKGAEGAAILDLVKGGVHFRCRLNFQSGQAKFEIDGLPDFHPVAQTALRSGGTHHVAFANIDRQLVLWVDGSPVTFDAPTDYEPLDNDRPRSTADDPADLAPAGIGSEACGLRVNHLRLWRDLYYIAAKTGPVDDYPPRSPNRPRSYQDLYEFWSTPKRWQSDGDGSLFDERREETFRLEADQFFMMGDNSPASLDARLWTDEKYVSRDLLIGKALLIFWPHSFDKLPGTNIPFPFFPNFARMGFIR